MVGVKCGGKNWDRGLGEGRCGSRGIKTERKRQMHEIFRSLEKSINWTWELNVEAPDPRPRRAAQADCLAQGGWPSTRNRN